MKRVLLLASVSSMIDQFNMTNIKLLQELGYKVDVACNFENGNTSSVERVQKFKKELLLLDIKFYQIDFPRNVFKFTQDIKAYKQVLKLMYKVKYDFVHCHSPIGGIIGRLASKKTKTRVIYTAHGLHFYKGAPLINWLLFYPIEKICAKWTDCLITINQEDYLLAQKKLKAKQIKYIPGVGIDISRYSCTHIDKQRSKCELGLPQNAFMLFSVGELNKNKNHQVVIRALANLQDKNIHYYIAGKGILENELMILAEQLSVKEQVHLLGFRDDVIKLYHAADVFLLPSYREGLSMALMEAMAAGLPVICSKIRGNCDLIVEEKGGIFCEAGNIEEFVQSIKRVKRDLKLRQQWGEFNAKKIESFDIDIVKQMMVDVYIK